MTPTPDAYTSPSPSPGSSSNAPPPLEGTARIEATTFALCSALAAHRSEDFGDTGEFDVTALCDSLLEDIPEEHHTAELVTGLHRASERLAFGLANFSHRALNRAYGELARTLAPFDGLDPGRLMSYGLDIGAKVLRNLEGDSPLQYELRQLAASAFGNALHGTGPTIDADTLQRDALSGDERDQAHVAALQAFRPVFKRLEEAGLCPAPVFRTYRRRTPQQGWNPVEDYGRFETQSDIFDSLLSLRPDDVTPLPRLALLQSDVHQTLDREKGVLVVTFPATVEQRVPVKATETTLKIPALSDSQDPIQRASQDAALDVLDRFCAASFGNARSLWSLRPPAITVDVPGRQIRVGELPVATLTPEGWSRDEDAATHMVDVFDPSFHRKDIRLDEWSVPRVPLPSASGTCPSGHRSLRLILQLENDRTIRESAASRQIMHPDESVLIQVDFQGCQRILAGENLLKGLPADTRIKVEVHGHGGRLGFADERCLSGRSAVEIACLLSDTMDCLGLRQQIDAVDLSSCALATPVFPRSFAAEVLKVGHDLKLFRPTAEVTAYTDFIASNLERKTLRPLGRRLTFLTASSRLPRVHAPGKSLAYSLSRGTGEVIVQDKHPEVEPDRPDAQATARLRQTSPLEDATDLPAISPWHVRGSGMAV